MEEESSKKKGKWWIYAIIIVLLIIIVVLLLLKGCGKSNKYKIKLHYGDEVIEVDENFNLADLVVEGGKISFLVDSDGKIVAPGSKLDKDKEYSGHLIPDGKETVKVTYKWDNDSLVIEYQKGSGLLFPAKNPTKSGYVFYAWKYEDIDDYPIYMMPVEQDMTLIAEFVKEESEDGKCTINCDTDKDGICDLNCDKNGDGTPDTNIDTNEDGIPDTNIDTDGDGTPDTNLDTDGDGKCDSTCEEEKIAIKVTNNTIDFGCELYPGVYIGIEDKYLVSATLDGKEIKPCTDCFWGATAFDFTEYYNSGKNMKLVANFVITDGNNQKYYLRAEADLIFAKDCDKTDKEITYKCEDYDNDGGFIFISPVEKENVKYVKIDGEEIKTETFHEDGGKSYPSYDLSNYFEDEKILNIEIGYNTPDSDGNTTYNVKVIFPKCEFGVSEYTLTLDPNGGTVSPTSLNYYGGQVIYNLPFPTRKGYQFVGWFTAKTGGKLVSDETSTEMPYNNMTIYAQWESNETPKEENKIYTLTYNANGGSVSPKEKALKSGASYGTLPTPTRDGYTFDGWYTKVSGGNKVSSSTKITANTTIYAHWTKEETPTPTPEPEPQDNGTISLSASNSNACIIGRQSIRVVATVSNARDNTVTWDADRCLTISGSGTAISVTANGCGETATVTGTLKNGKSSSIELKIEDTLSVTVEDYGTNTPNSEGYYEGVKKITTNIPSTIASPNGAIIYDATGLRSSVVTNASSDGIVNITTPCGQTKTIRWTAVIN